MSHDLTSHQGPLSPYPAVAPAVSLPGAGTVDLVDIVRRNFWLILGYTILCVSAAVAHVVLARRTGWCTRGSRSEEHTSELQSRGHLVCRLLLEKKNIASSTAIRIVRTIAP